MSKKKIVVPDHDRQRFWRLVDKTEYCWNWTGDQRAHEYYKKRYMEEHPNAKYYRQRKNS